MKDCYELKNPRKNPYAERMKNGYTIIIDREPLDINEVEPDEIDIITAMKKNSDCKFNFTESELEERRNGQNEKV